MDFIGRHDGVKLSQLSAAVNMRTARINKALAFLMNDGFIRKEESCYYITPKPFVYDRAHYASVTETRRREMEQMKQLARTKDCLSRYIVSCLDDHTAQPCGHCANCRGKDLYPAEASWPYVFIAEEYVNRQVIAIEPRKMWVTSSVTTGKKIEHMLRPGFCLSRYGDAGYGELVKQGKYSKEKRFCDELVGKSAQMLRPFVGEHGITHVCPVPSLRSGIVADFTRRLAASLKLEYTELLVKTEAVPQKRMENSAHQCENAYRSFHVAGSSVLPKNILLVDDVVDSRWTLTVCGFRLMEAGAENVYPFALADSSNRED